MIEDWSPCLLVDDALKLDAIRIALRDGEIKIAKKLAKVYSISEVAA